MLCFLWVLYPTIGRLIHAGFLSRIELRSLTHKHDGGTIHTIPARGRRQGTSWVSIVQVQLHRLAHKFRVIKVPFKSLTRLKYGVWRLITMSVVCSFIVYV